MQNVGQFGSVTAPCGALRVLVVEDETLLSLALETMLGEWGHAITGSAATGAHAIRLAREASPDVVLMDINLAGDMDGLSAATRIRDFCEAEIVFMTAYSDKDLAARPELAGAEVLRKPFSPRRLREILDGIAAAAAGAGLAARATERGDGADSR